MASKQKLTPWFPPSVKPVRVGIYLRGWPSGAQYARWDGVKWLSSWGHLSYAETYSRTESGVQDKLSWRGLAEKPA